MVLSARHWRIFFSARNADNQSAIYYADVDPGDDMRVLDIVDKPLLPPAKPGTFESAGHGPCFVHKSGAEIQLYYIGMHLRRDVPYSIAIGLALSHDGGETFSRLADGPVLGPNLNDPFFTSSLCLSDESETELTGWYMTATGWEAREGSDPDPVYGLRRASSKDNGRSWVPASGTVGLGDGVFDDPVGLARPWVADVFGQRALWFSHRARENFRTETDAAYRIMNVPLNADDSIGGPAQPLAFSNPPETGDWDVFMQAYPAIVPYEGGYVLLYNGNGFGQTGFGWATLGL